MRSTRPCAARSRPRKRAKPHLRTRRFANPLQFRYCGRLELPERFTEPLVVLADLVTRARSGVPRDGYSRELLYLPEPEAPTRFAKQLAQLGAAALAIGVDETETWRLLRKVGWDSVPAVRCSVIECLARQTEPVPLAKIQEETGLPPKTVERVVEDVVSLQLAKRRKDANRWLIEQSEIAREYWAEELSPETSEGPHTNGRRRPPSFGDEEFPLMLANAVRDGHITHAEAEEQLAVHRILEKQRV